MYKTMILITICGWIVAGGAFAVDGGGKDSSTAGTVKSRTFNVLKYGAIGDDKTDNTDADNIILGSNSNGLEFVHAAHASRFGRVCAQHCTHAIAVTGMHGFSIEQLDIEIAGPGHTTSDTKWQITEYDVNDPKNLGVADINYGVVEGGVGVVEKFTRNGGAAIQARRIGSGTKE